MAREESEALGEHNIVVLQVFIRHLCIRQCPRPGINLILHLFCELAIAGT